MGWIRIMNSLCRKRRQGERRACCKGQQKNPVEKTEHTARKEPEHTGEAAQAKADVQDAAADLEDLKEELNFRLLCGELDFRLRHEVQQHIPDGDRVLWVEDIRLVSCKPPSVDVAKKKKPSLWGRMKDCLLGRRAARQGSSPHKKK